MNLGSLDRGFSKSPARDQLLAGECVSVRERVEGGFVTSSGVNDRSTVPTGGRVDIEIDREGLVFEADPNDRVRLAVDRACSLRDPRHLGSGLIEEQTLGDQIFGLLAEDA